MPLTPHVPATATQRTAAWLCACLLAGCQPVMSTPSRSAGAQDLPDGSYTITTDEWPLRFRAHNFGAATYSTYGCKVFYAGMVRVDDPDDELRNSSASIGDKYPDNMRGGWGPIRNFPPPARVAWRSKDGTAHEAEVDIAEIFNNGLIRHNVPRDELLRNQGMLPEIIIEVNDRTINVYMRAHLSTKELQEPGNRYSDFRNDLIKAYSQTY